MQVKENLKLKFWKNVLHAKGSHLQIWFVNNTSIVMNNTTRKFASIDITFTRSKAAEPVSQIKIMNLSCWKDFISSILNEKKDVLHDKEVICMIKESFVNNTSIVLNNTTITWNLTRSKSVLLYHYIIFSDVCSTYKFVQN